MAVSCMQVELLHKECDAEQNNQTSGLLEYCTDAERVAELAVALRVGMALIPVGVGCFFNR